MEDWKIASCSFFSPKCSSGCANGKPFETQSPVTQYKGSGFLCALCSTFSGNVWMGTNNWIPSKKRSQKQSVMHV